MPRGGRGGQSTSPVDEGGVTIPNVLEPGERHLDELPFDLPDQRLITSQRVAKAQGIRWAECVFRGLRSDIYLSSIFGK